MTGRATDAPQGLRWIAPVLGLATFAALWWGFAFRGASESGLEFADAASHVARWWLGEAATSEAWRGSWPPLTLGTVGGLVALGMGPLRAGHFVSALSLSLCVPVVWGLGRRAGGPPGAVGAVAVFVLTPRILGLGTTVGPGAAAVCGFCFAVYAMYRARRSAAWTAVAPFALGLAILNGQAGLLLVPLWLVLTVTDKGLTRAWMRREGLNPNAPPGFVETTSFPLRLLLIPAVALPLALFGSPLAWSEGPAAWAGHFVLGWVEQALPPIVYLDELVTSGRLPWHAGPVILAATMTPVGAVLGLAGVLSEMVIKWLRASPMGRLLPQQTLTADPEAAGPEAREAKRWVFGALLAVWAGSWLAGRTGLHGLDFVALALPFVAVFAGCTLSRLMTRAASAIETRDLPIPRRVPLAVAVAAFGTFIFVPGAIDCARSHPSTEAYYNLFVNGAEGAVQKGFSRNPDPVAPVAVLNAVKGEGTVAFLGHASHWKRAANAYAREGLAPPLDVVAVSEADSVVLSHADEAPRYPRDAGLFAASTTNADCVVLRSGSLRLFTIATRTKIRR